MKNVVFVCLFLVSSILFGADDISIVPSSKTMTGGDTETFDVNISNVSELRGFEIEINYNTSYLKNIVLTEGTFLDNADGNSTQWYVTGITSSYIANCAILGSTNGATGNGTLFTIQVDAEDVSSTVVTNMLLSAITLRDKDNHRIDYGTVNNTTVTINPNFTEIFIVGSWPITNISSSDIINENDVESTDNEVYVDITGTANDADTWRVDIKRTDTNWHGDFILSFKRVNDGNGSGSISGGTTYQIVTTSDQTFYTGAGDRSDIYLQNNLSGISYQIPPDTYITTIQLTIIDD
ncbi:MAG: cohesin domain-containing protein [Candidatus Marinimicrobia bacterium]|nr:cohesin domain-containing protein [Candidatus Neomarinimicrobiota bacterium]